MSSVLNIGNCATTGNTALVSCNVEPGLFKYGIYAPIGSVVPAASLTSGTALLTYIIARLNDSNRSTRWFLTPPMDSFKNQTEADKTETRDMFKPYTAKGTYNFMYRFDCLKCDFNNQRNFHLQQQKYGLFFIDDNLQFLGTKATDSTGAPAAGVFTPYQIWLPDYKPKTIDTQNEYWVIWQFVSNAQFNENMVGVAAQIVVPSIPYINQGLLEVGLIDLTTTVSAAAHTAAIGGTLACGSSYLADTYGATLAAAGAWVVNDTTVSASIIPSGVTYVPASGSLPGYYLFAFTVAPTATHIYSFALAAPSVLLASPYDVNLVTETSDIATHTF